MECFKQKTKRQELDDLLDYLNELLNLRQGTIHDYRAYGGTMLVTGGNDELSGVGRISDPQMIKVVRQIISVVEFAIKPYPNLGEYSFMKNLHKPRVSPDTVAATIKGA